MTSPNNNILLGVVTGAVVTTIALGAAAATVRQQTKIPLFVDEEIKCNTDPTSGNIKNVRLGIVESKKLTNPINQGAISTITFVRGNIESANFQLCERLRLVLKGNPWLCGNLKREKDKNITLNYPSQITDSHVNAIFNPKLRGRRKIRVPVFNSTMDISQICNEAGCSDCEILHGRECIDNEEPLVALSILPDSIRNDTFAVIFSVSHAIIDGSTYYSLLSMISADGKPSAMNFVFKSGMNERKDRAMGIPESEYINFTSSALNWAYTAFISPIRPIPYNFYIDSNRVHLAKETAKKDPSFKGFLGTNDIITSSFGNATSAGLVFMAINYRNRLSDLCDNDAGNYIGGLIFGPHANCSPITIRNTLQRGLPVCHRLNCDRLPTGLQNLFTKMAIATSWLFPAFNELKLDGCEQMLHTPIFNLSLVPMEICVIYRPRADQVAVFCLCRRVDVDGLQEMMPTGEAVTNAEQASMK
jgi:hypothetical protein